VLRIGIDVGGTFTDVVGLRDGRELFIAKVPTTPGRLANGILRGVERLLQVSGLTAANVVRFTHSTTVATNAILEQRGARVALLATEGFRDILEIGRQKRNQMYDLFADGQTPTFLAPRRLRVGIRERIDADGSVLVPLDEVQLAEAVDALVRREQIQAVAVCYLFSFLNPLHERRTREVLQQRFPDLGVSLSSDVDPVFREYERTCVTAFDAYVRPIVATYLRALEDELVSAGVKVELQVMQSRGALTRADLAIERPVSMLLSGPASGVMGGRYAGAQSGLDSVITVDIGGTSCDVALVKEGKPLISREGRIGDYPLRVSMVDVNTIGAGGGSLAWRDESGRLHVGPQSAGADPGPICYGRGGSIPTVTDASVVLGYLNPAYFAGGDIPLNPAAARAGMTGLARDLDLTVEALAAGIHRIVNERMANEIRLVSVKRGHDPRRFALVPLGGAGAVHAGRLAALLAIPTVLVPQAPGVLSAFGLLVAHVEHEQTRTIGMRLDEPDLARLGVLVAELDTLCHTRMARERVRLDSVRIAHFLDVRYVGQSYELEVPLGHPVTAAAVVAAVAAFHALHETIYGYQRAGSPLEAVNLRVVHTAPADEVAPAPAGPGGEGGARARKGNRPVYFDEWGEYRDAPVYERRHLRRDELIQGPAVVEQPDTTTVVYPGQDALVDPAGNLLLSVAIRSA
jgi:N-methylhydantoinase A